MKNLEILGGARAPFIFDPEHIVEKHEQIDPHISCWKNPQALYHILHLTDTYLGLKELSGEAGAINIGIEGYCIALTAKNFGDINSKFVKHRTGLYVYANSLIRINALMGVCSGISLSEIEEDIANGRTN